MIKYIGEDIVEDQIKTEKNKVWKGLAQPFLLIDKWVTQKICKGDKLILGENPWIGFNGNCRLSPVLIERLHAEGFTRLSDVATRGFHGEQASNHLFVTSHFSTSVWKEMLQSHNCSLVLDKITLLDCFECCIKGVSAKSHITMP